MQILKTRRRIESSHALRKIRQEILAKVGQQQRRRRRRRRRSRRRRSSNSRSLSMNCKGPTTKKVIRKKITGKAAVLILKLPRPWTLLLFVSRTVMGMRRREKEEEEEACQQQPSQGEETPPRNPSDSLHKTRQRHEHPIYGTLLADFGWRKVFCASARTFVDAISIWHRQRPCDEDQIIEIAMYDGDVFTRSPWHDFCL